MLYFSIAVVKSTYETDIRRRELVSIQWENITFVLEGMEVLIARSKTDQEGEGQVCAIPRSDNLLLCPVTAITRII